MNNVLHNVFCKVPVGSAIPKKPRYQYLQNGELFGLSAPWCQKAPDDFDIDKEELYSSFLAAFVPQYCDERTGPEFTQPVLLTGYRRKKQKISTIVKDVASVIGGCIIMLFAVLGGITTLNYFLGGW